MNRQRAASWAVATAAVAVVAVGVAAGTGPVVHSRPTSTIRYPNLTRPSTPVLTAPRRAGPGTGLAPTPSGSGVSADVVIAAVAALVAVAVALLVARALLRWARGSDDSDVDDRHGDARLAPAVGGTQDSDLPELLAAVGQAEDLLRDETDPRRAVLGCWLRLEEAVARSGAPRAPSETSGELTARVMLEYAVEPDAIASLHALYRQARYSPAPVSASAREQAQRALATVRAGLEVRRSPATTGADRP